MYTPAFKTLKPLEESERCAAQRVHDALGSLQDFGGRLPEVKRNQQSDTSIRQQERLQDGLQLCLRFPRHCQQV